MSGGDLISQTIIEKKNLQHIEWIRPVRFFGMGFFFVVRKVKLGNASSALCEAHQVAIVLKGKIYRPSSNSKPRLKAIIQKY